MCQEVGVGCCKSFYDLVFKVPECVNPFLLVKKSLRPAQVLGEVPYLPPLTGKNSRSLTFRVVPKLSTNSDLHDVIRTQRALEGGFSLGDPVFNSVPLHP